MYKSAYTPTIGIECHVQLNTKTKLFSAADNDARDKSPNTTVNEICFGLPGTLPVLNQQAVHLALKAGIALQSDIPRLSRFERKHYFYPDLPKGYQTTQLAEPIIGSGKVVAILVDGSEKVVRIHHAHLEEDAGKLTHPQGANFSLVDLNRAGTPLIEIVSEADMHSPAEARAYAEELYLLMTYAEVTGGDLFHGNMRFDVNVSVAREGDPLGTRTETKNLNSFRAVEKAAEYEINRQIKLLDQGESIIQETRGWNEDKQITFSQRSKEDAHDYRYFPDADLPPIEISEVAIEDVKKSMPKMPSEYRKGWTDSGLSAPMIRKLLSNRQIAEYIEAIRLSYPDSFKNVCNWTVSVLTNTDDILKILPHSLNDLSVMVSANELSSSAAKEVLVGLVDSQLSARELAEEKNLIQVNDTAFVEQVVDQVISDPASKKAIDDIRAGNDKAIGYLVGQVMKLSAGKANPAIVNQIIRKKI